LADKKSKELLVILIAFRLLGPKKIKMPLFDKNKWVKYYEILNHTQDDVIPALMFDLYKIDLNFLGFNINFYYDPLSVFIGFVLKQYEYTNKAIKIKALDGDIVIDGGACYGDTALYFAHEVGSTGKVFSFEFVQENIDIMKKNIELNQDLKNQIEIIEYALHNISDEIISFEEMGPATQANNLRGDAVNVNQITATTISLDDFVQRKN